MSFVAAAVVGGAGATYFSSKNAAEAQTNAANQATNTQLGMFNKTQQNLQPFIGAGANQLPQLAAWNDPNNTNSPLAALLKLIQPGADQSATLSQTPGYQFAQTQGLKAVNNALAARGLGGSGGPVAKGAAAFTTGLAQNTWQSQVDNLLKTYLGGGGQLQNLVNTGANAAAGLGNNAVQTGGQVGGNIIGAGNAQAGANIATGNAIGGVGNSISTAMLLRQLSGANGGTGGIYGDGNANPGSYANPMPGLTSADYEPGGY